jgi:hypothetical protein
MRRGHRARKDFEIRRARVASAVAPSLTWTDAHVRTLVIVDRSKLATFARLRDLFSGEPDVHVIWDRRRGERRQRQESRDPDRRVRDRRCTVDPFGGRDFIVVHVEPEPSVESSRSSESAPGRDVLSR